MRNHALVAAIFAAAVASSVGVVGCTSLLGDFEVSGAVPGPGDDGGDGAAACTKMCGGQCVDVATSATNCGDCGVVCSGGQTCAAGKCGCSGTLALCGGQCVASDRAHCGPTCGACLADEVCSDHCVPAPAPEFGAVPRDPTGWTELGNVPISFKIKPTGIPGTIYECRTGPADSFSPTVPEWKSCDGANGSQPVHKPSPVSAKPEGSYRTEYRYRSDTYRSATVSYDFYVHHHLDAVSTCPRAGHPEDGPRFTDDQYFQAALSIAAFDVTSTFAVPGTKRDDAFFLRNPWIKIPFVGVQHTKGMRTTWPAAATFDYTFEERSLRHRFVLNATRSMMLVKRIYTNAKKNDCKNNFSFGNITSGDDALKHGVNFGTYGPDGLGRGPHVLDCEALVMNVHGRGLCIGRKAVTDMMPQVLAVDHTPTAPGYFVNGAGSFAAQAQGLTTLTLTGATFGFGAGQNGVQNGYYIELATGSNPPVHWYKVVSSPPNGTTAVTISPALKNALPAGQPWRYAVGTAAINIIPTAFTKAFGNTGNWNNLQSAFTPSHGTKCITEGCDAGKPWMTFLPP